MNILVLGGTQFVGKHIVNSLLNTNHNINPLILALLSYDQNLFLMLIWNTIIITTTNNHIFDFLLLANIALEKLNELALVIYISK